MAQETKLEKSETVETVTKSVGRLSVALWLLLGMNTLLALVSIPSGISMLIDPSGSVIGGQFVLPSLTKAIPWIHDFVPIGIWLVTAFGALPIIVSTGVWLRQRWAWYISMLLGATVVTWIGFEILMFFSLGFTFFYPLIGGIGIAILGLSSLRSVRRSLHIGKGWREVRFD